MELYDYIKILQKAWGFIMLVTMVFVAVAIVFVVRTKPTFSSALSITVERQQVVSQKDANFFEYDGFYNVQSSGLFADTLANMLQTPQVVESIFERAGQKTPQVKSISHLAKIFVVRKLPPATLSLTVETPSATQGSSLLNAAVQELEIRSQSISLLNKEDQFKLYASSSTSVVNKISLSFAIIIAVVLGLVLSTFIVFVRQFLTQK